MSRRNFVNASMENVETLRAALQKVEALQPFHKSTDPFATLASEIEACRRKIHQCVEQGREKVKVVETAKIENKANASKPEKSSQLRGNLELKVYPLKVVELKKELKSRGLDTNGLKKDLQARLLDALMAELEEQPGPASEMEQKVVSPTKSTQQDTEMAPAVATISQDSQPEQSDEEMADASGNDNDGKDTGAPSPEESGDMKVDEGQPVISGPDVKSSQNSRDYWMNKAKSASVPKIQTNSNKNESSSSSASRSPLRGVVKSALKVFGAYGQSSSQQPPDRLDDPADDVSPPSSEVSSSCSKISGPSVRELVSKISSSSSFQTSQSGPISLSKTLPSGGGSALSKTLQAKKEARLARMAEIREKSKPLASSKVALTPKEYTSTLSSLNATAASATGKTKDLAAMRAQMREKAAASKLRKENVPVNSNSQPTLMSAGKRTFPSTQSGMVPDSLGTTVKQGFLKKAKVVSSPLDTYEISDREDSDTDDSDDSDDENREPGKKIPSWASKQALYRALEQQYNGCVDGRRVDPDELFPEVQTCDLEAIFGSRKNARYKTRTSSANWKDDQVTMQEKLVYKRKMGYSTQQASEI